MKTIAKRAIVALAVLFAAGDVQIASEIGIGPVGGFVSSAEAAVVVRRPAVRPVSAAGVARRTTRRVIRRSTTFVAVVPAGCAYGTYYGYNLYYCGGVYYQRSGSGYVIVYF